MRVQPGLPHQPPAGVAASLTLNAPPREEVTTLLSTPPPPAWASSGPTKGAGATTVGVVFLIVAFGAVLAYVIQRWGTHADRFKIANQTSAASGFYLLHMIAAPGWVTSIPRWVDALVTGLIVGTGTKPLHGLINRAQSGGK